MGSNKDKGRPEKNSDEELKEILTRFITESQREGISQRKIAFLELEKFTEECCGQKISRFTWKRRMGATIEHINNYELTIDTEQMEPLPLVRSKDIIEKCYRNKQLLIREMSSRDDYIQNLYNKAVKFDALERKNKKIELQSQEFKDERDYYKQLADHYKAQYETVVIESHNAIKRREKGYNNVLDIKGNIDKALSMDFEEKFPELLGED